MGREACIALHARKGMEREGRGGKGDEPNFPCSPLAHLRSHCDARSSSCFSIRC